MIPRHCTRCQRPIWVWPWQNAYCRDFDQCIREGWRLMTAPTAYLAVMAYPPTPRVEEPVWEPWLPDLTALPPDDIDVCSRCLGRGEHPHRQDWETGAIEYEACGRCWSTGKEPVWLG